MCCHLSHAIRSIPPFAVRTTMLRSGALSSVFVVGRCFPEFYGGWTPSSLCRIASAAKRRRRPFSTSVRNASMDRSLVALVTGGSSGLGAGAARALAAGGAKVLVADLPHQEATFQSWNTSGDRVSFCAMDVTDPKQVEHALDTLAERFAVPAPNLVVNCAGIATARKTISIKQNETTIRVHPIEEFSKTLQINTVGTFLVSTLVAERMCRQQQKSSSSSEADENYCIVNTASIAAYEGQVGQVAYSASKGAIVGMTLPLARDLAPYRIRCMTIAPGLFDTPLVDQLPPAVKERLGQMPPFPNRLGQAEEEFGRLVVHIFENRYLNGSVIRLDGALRMPP